MLFSKILNFNTEISALKTITFFTAVKMLITERKKFVDTQLNVISPS